MGTIYKYNKNSIKRNVLTIKQNISGCRSGQGLISTPVYLYLYEIQRRKMFRSVFLLVGGAS